MKVLTSYPTNGITAVTCSQVESALWPIDNVLDEHPKKYALSAYPFMRIVCAAAANNNAVTAFNIRATAVQVSVSVGNPITLKPDAPGAMTLKTGIGAVTLLGGGNVASTTIFALNPNSIGTLWVDYPSIAVAHVVEIILIGGSPTAYVGCIVGKNKLAFRSPLLGRFQETSKDLSIVVEMSNGSIEIEDKDVLRKFTWSFVARVSDTVAADALNNFYSFMHDLRQVIKSHPVPWKFHDSSTDSEWVVYGRFDGEPIATYTDDDIITVSASIIEVV